MAAPSTAKYKLNFDMIDPEYIKILENNERSFLETGNIQGNNRPFFIQPHSFKKLTAGSIVELDTKVGEQLCARRVPLHYQSLNKGTTGHISQYPDVVFQLEDKTEPEDRCTWVNFAERVDG